jgi:hypothetical protein
MWRAAAKLARQQIVHADPNNVVEILKVSVLYKEKKKKKYNIHILFSFGICDY